MRGWRLEVEVKVKGGDRWEGLFVVLLLPVGVWSNTKISRCHTYGSASFFSFPPPRFVFRDQMRYVMRFTRRRRAKGASHHRARSVTASRPWFRRFLARRPLGRLTTRRQGETTPRRHGAALSPPHPVVRPRCSASLLFSFLRPAIAPRVSVRGCCARRRGAHRRRPRTRCGVCAPEGEGLGAS